MVRAGARSGPGTGLVRTLAHPVRLRESNLLGAPGLSRQKTILATVAVLAALGATGGAVFLYTGIYNVAADVPHTSMFRWAVTTMQRNSVERHAQPRESPPLDDAELVQHGFRLYRELCVTCHGAPGVYRLKDR